MQKRNAPSSDQNRASRGWPIDGPVGETRLDRLLIVMDEPALVVDEPAKAPLLTRAAAVGSALGCRLTLYVPCEDDTLSAALAGMDDALRDRQALADLAATRAAERARWLESQGVSRVETCVRWEPLEADLLLRRTRELEADLIIKSGTAARFLFGLMTHTDWDLLRQAPVPVWFVSETEHGSSVTSVLTALGDSEHPEDILGAHDYNLCALADLIAAKTSARHSIVHAYQVPQVMPPLAAYAPEAAALPQDVLSENLDRQRQIAAEHREAVTAFAQLFHLDRNRILLQSGRLSDVIHAVAKRTEADLIVMGSRNLTRWQRLLRPVNAEAVLTQAPCDVLILPHIAADPANGSERETVERETVEGTPQLDLEAAVVNPEAVFGTPDALMDCSALSVAFRRRLLKIWESDVRAEMVEEDEGGPVGPPQADWLQQIHDAADRLTGDETTRRAASAQPEFF